MEFYVNTKPTATFHHPHGTNPTNVEAKHSINGEAFQVAWQATVTDTTNGTSTYVLPYLKEEGYVDIQWSFDHSGGTDVVEERYDIVTPYLAPHKIISIVGDAEWQDAEAVVRNIINGHCGQSFGKKTDSKLVYGRGGGSLRLPHRLISLTSVETRTEVLSPDAFHIHGDGWYLDKRLAEVLSVKNTEDEEIIADRGPVIYHPYATNRNVWKNDYPFTINGVWGHEKVPTNVAQAAEILIDDYACSDAAYRDRYLKTIRAADWQLAFFSGAFARTGNAKADQLLEPYVVEVGWTVI